MNMLLRGIRGLALGLGLAASVLVSGQGAKAQAELPDSPAEDGVYQEVWPVAAENGAAFNGVGGWVEVEWGSANGGGLAPEALPVWWRDCVALGGICEPGLGWFVNEAEPAGAGRLCFEVDRTAWVGGFVLELTYLDTVGSTLFLGLLDTNAAIAELTGNLTEGSGRIQTAWFSVPWAAYENVDTIFLLRGVGPSLVYRTVLLSDSDLDGVPDAYELAWFGTLDYDPGEVTPPGQGPGAPPVAPVSGGDDPEVADPGEGRDSAASLRWTFPLLESRMAGYEFVVSRSVMSGGGTRQTGGVFVMEDTIAQPSPIGFSSLGPFVLHAGYQQAEETQPLLFYNVSVMPGPYDGIHRRFNPGMGETSTFSYVVSPNAQWVRVEVWSEANTNAPVATWVSSNVAAGLHTVQWCDADVAANVYYDFRLSGMSLAGRYSTYVPADTNEVRIQVSRNIKVITQWGDLPEPFYPPGQTCVISHAVSHGSPDMVVTIENSYGTWVTNFNVKANDDVSWLGGTNGDGFYTYTVAQDLGGSEKDANPRTGSILLLRESTNLAASTNGLVRFWYPGVAPVAITQADGPDLTNALLAIYSEGGSWIPQSAVYEIHSATTTFAPPAVMAFGYDPVISGDIADKLVLRWFDPDAGLWRPVARQVVDYANHQIVAEVDHLSLYALFSGQDTTAPSIRILSPEPREYFHDETIAVLYEVADMPVGGFASGVDTLAVFLNGELFTNSVILPEHGRLGENVLTVMAIDRAGNVGWVGVRFGVILRVGVTIKPEALNVNPGILTAFVTFPAGYKDAVIESAICDGAPAERILAGGEPGEWTLKFRRQDIETALAEHGEALDIHFLVRGSVTHQGQTRVFQGQDNITKILDK